MIQVILCICIPHGNEPHYDPVFNFDFIISEPFCFTSAIDYRLKVYQEIKWGSVIKNEAFNKKKILICSKYCKMELGDKKAGEISMWGVCYYMDVKHGQWGNVREMR